MKIDYDNKDFWLFPENKHEEKFLLHLLKTHQGLRPLAGVRSNDLKGLQQLQLHISSQKGNND